MILQQLMGSIKQREELNTEHKIRMTRYKDKDKGKFPVAAGSDGKHA